MCVCVCACVCLSVCVCVSVCLSVWSTSRSGVSREWLLCRGVFLYPWAADQQDYEEAAQAQEERARNSKSAQDTSLEGEESLFARKIRTSRELDAAK